MRRTAFSLVAMLLFSMPVVGLLAETIDNPPPDWLLYIEAVELLADGQEPAATVLFREFMEKYPDSYLADRAGGYLERLEGKLDRSGIVGFYLGTMATTTFAAFSIPEMIGVDAGLVGAGLYGLAGVGGGFASAWFLTKDRDWSAGQELWTELTQIAVMANTTLASTEWLDDLITQPEYLLRANLAVANVSAVGSRAAAYLMVRDGKYTADRPIFAASAYAWAHLYSLGTTTGLLQLESSSAVTAVQILVPDAALLAGAYGWDSFGWSASRTGLVNVGGIGGLLVGSFLALMVEGIYPERDERVNAVMVMASAAAGKGLAAHLTRNFDARSRSDKGLSNLSILPAIDSRGGMGATVRLAY